MTDWQTSFADERFSDVTASEVGPDGLVKSVSSNDCHKNNCEKLFALWSHPVTRSLI